MPWRTTNLRPHTGTRTPYGRRTLQ